MAGRVAVWPLLGLLALLAACARSEPPPASCPPEDAVGAVYYVSPQGDDQGSGSREDPWRTPGLATRRLQPGDTLVILPGRYVLKTYPGDILTVPPGEEGRWVTICGPTEEPAPVLMGQDNLRAAINLSGARYARIYHLEITHNPDAEKVAFRDGILALDRPIEHVVLRDLYIHHLDQFGIDLRDAYDLVIEDSRIEYCGFGAIGSAAGKEGGLRQLVVRHSRLSYSGHYYQGGDGSDRPYDRPDGFGVEASQGPVWIEGVVAEHNRGDGLDSKVAETIIRNSIVANNWGDGVKLWGERGVLENVLIYGRGDGDPRTSPWAALVVHTPEEGARFELRHVTLDDALGQNYLIHVQYDDPDVPVELVLRNVIFSARGDRSALYLAPGVRLDAAGVMFAYRDPADLLRWRGESYGCDRIGELGERVFCGEPDFLRPAWGEEGDYHLGPRSQAIDAGVAAGVAFDLDGRRRDKRPDLGAYEYRP